MNDAVEEIVLSLTTFNVVTPSAQIVALRMLSLAHNNSLELLGSFGSGPSKLTVFHIGLSPEIKELLRAFESDTSVNKLVAFTRLMHTVEGVSVPESEIAPFRITKVLKHDPIQPS